MAEIVDFAAAKQEREPHFGGPAMCIACKYEWYAVAPVESGANIALDCPSCGLHKGFFMNLVERGPEAWVCRCNDCPIFAINKQGIYCINCGQYQEGMWD